MNSRKIYLTILVVLILTCETFAQDNSQEFGINFNSMTTGREYRIKIENGWETEGVLISNDPISIIVRSEFKTFTIEKAQITDVIESKSNKILGHISRKNSPESGNDSRESRIDSQRFPMVIGREYRIKTKNGRETEGVLISKDSNSIIVKSGLKTITIEKEKIKDVFDFTNKLSVSAGIGLNFLSSDLSEDYYPGVDFQLSLNNRVTDYYAIRGSFEFTHNPVKHSSGRWTPPPEDLSTYSFKFDFLFGELSNMSMVNAYAFVGAGYTNVTQKYKSSAYLPLEAGAGFGYKISDRIRLFGEGQYAFNMVAGAFDGVLYKNVAYPSVRIGVQVGLW